MATRKTEVTRTTRARTLAGVTATWANLRALGLTDTQISKALEPLVQTLKPLAS